MSYKCEYKRSLDYTQPNVENVFVNDTQTIVAGDLLVISGGKASKAGAAPGTVVLGIALAALTTTTANATTDYIPVLMLNSKSVFRIAYSGTAPTLADKFGTLYDIIVTTQVMDMDDTTGGFLRIVNYNTTDGWCDVVVASAALWTK